MKHSRQFEQYLDSFRLRLTNLVVAHGAASVAVAALLVSLLVVAAAVQAGFPDDFMIFGRVVLLAILGGIAYHFFIVRRRRTGANAATEIEQRTPEFAGRVEAYVDTQDDTNPMRELLAEESLGIAADHAPDRQVQPREFQLAWSAAAIAAVALLLVAIAGPGNYAYGVRALWVGWAFPGLLPPQSIEVLPGDDGIRLGGSVKVRATMQGFEPQEAWVHARFGDDDWQQVPMSETDERFEFTFFSVRQPLEYYVSANNVRSPTYQVNVVDLPNVVNLALTYRYPDWTEREPDVFDPGGDIRAIVDTEVEVQITTDRPMTPGAVILNDEGIALDIDGTTATASFRLEADGQYYVASTVGGERIRLTDDYFIRILEDQAPEITFARPGRDWSASRIEEVTTRITAKDDFRVNSIEMHYAVNGGDWQQVDLGIAGESIEIDHVFFLESLAGNGDSSLPPGSLVTYYAVAEDRENTARTDMFFVDVQEFDKRYTQSQMGGGMQGGPQNEVSQRQREIIISTWNLIRERSEKGRGHDAFILDNAAMLSRLQETLRGQVETLAQRAEARELTATDEEIAEFVDNLRQAAEAMIPAAELLADIELDQALMPEQEALQHLLAAEAVFDDINISMQSGGRGGQAGRDISEMFELEMDLKKNQYETGSTASPEAPEQLQDAADELAELARRQEQLARNRRNSQMTPEQRWQQEMLRREVEELQQRLEQMSANRQSQSQSQSQSGQSSSNGESQSSQSQGGEPSERELNDLQRRMQSALRAMDEAEQSMQGGGDPESMQRAMAEAQRQLEGARQSALEASKQAMRAAIQELAEQARDIHETQAGFERELQQAVREAAGDDPDGALGSGLTWQEELELAAAKRDLAEDLQELVGETRGTAQTFDETQSRAAGELLEGLNRIQELEIEARLSIAAAWIEQGHAMYVASSESAVTEALRQLRDDLRRAESMVEGGNAGALAGEDRLGQALAEARTLRRALQQATGQQAMNQQGGTSGGDLSSGPEDPQIGTSSGNVTEDIDATVLERQAQTVSDGVFEAMRDLAYAGANSQDLDELRQLAAGIRASDFSGNPDVLAREVRRALSIAEQIELQLSRAVEGDTRGIRGSADEEIPEQHREAVADYYRRLGESGTD